MDRKRNDNHSVFNIASVSRLISSCLEQNSSKSRSMKNLKTAHSTVSLGVQISRKCQAGWM